MDTHFGLLIAAGLLFPILSWSSGRLAATAWRDRHNRLFGRPAAHRKVVVAVLVELVFTALAVIAWVGVENQPDFSLLSGETVWGVVLLVVTFSWVVGNIGNVYLALEGY
jgi:uncharacterized PurR-regulated membrane protein YhhQ (DUF165 family)